MGKMNGPPAPRALMHSILHTVFIWFTRSPLVWRVRGCLRAVWWTLTHTRVSPRSSSTAGSLHWLRAEKKPAGSGRGAASACGTDTGLSSPPSQNQRKVMMSGWKPEAWAVMVTTPGERTPSVMSLNKAWEYIFFNVLFLLLLQKNIFL